MSAGHVATIVYGREEVGGAVAVGVGRAGGALQGRGTGESGDRDEQFVRNYVEGVVEEVAEEVAEGASWRESRDREQFVERSLTAGCGLSSAARGGNGRPLVCS